VGFKGSPMADIFHLGISKNYQNKVQGGEFLLFALGVTKQRFYKTAQGFNLFLPFLSFYAVHAHQTYQSNMQK